MNKHISYENDITTYKKLKIVTKITKIKEKRTHYLRLKQRIFLDNN